MKDIQELVKLFSKCDIESVAQSKIILDTAIQTKNNLIDEKIAELDKEIENEIQGLVAFFTMKMGVIEVLIKLKKDLEHEKRE